MVKHRDDFMERFYNPILLVKEENVYSVVARTEAEEKDNRPYRRYTKRKDNNGEFIIRFRKKIYREKWETIIS